MAFPEGHNDLMTRSAEPASSPAQPALKLSRLYAIIDPAQTRERSSLQIAADLLAAGVRLIQLRDKHAASGELFASAKPIASLVRKSGGTFILNDRADVARVVECDGVHVGQDDLPVDPARALMGPDKIIGFSTHDLDQVRQADNSSANYIAFGPVFATTSKNHPDPVVGLDGLRAARKLTRKPLVAIGGITLQNAHSVIEAGADSIAVIRDLVGASDIRRRAAEWIELVNS